MRGKDLANYYQDGYDVGYTWMQKGWNFVHPAEIRSFSNGRVLNGYVPGGPTVYPDDKAYPRFGNKGKDPFPAQARDRWFFGFYTGLNHYVRENKLPFPEISSDYIDRSSKVHTNWDEIKPILDAATK